MEEFNKRAISEVIEILNHTDKEIVEKIPQKFINFLFENADNDYKPNINFYDDDWKNSVQDDTQAILALIYRDYIVSDDERKELLKEEQEDKLKREKELQEKYNPDNLFKKKTVEIQTPNNEVQLVKVNETSWFKKVLNKIFSFFGRKKN